MLMMLQGCVGIIMRHKYQCCYSVWHSLDNKIRFVYNIIIMCLNSVEELLVLSSENVVLSGLLLVGGAIVTILSVF